VADLDKIQSPLPPRRIIAEEKSEDTTPPPVTPEEPKVSGKVSTPIEEKKPNLLKVYGLWIGIGVVVILIIVVVAKLIWPNATAKKNQPMVTLNYWGLWEDSSIIEGVIAEFEAKNPEIKVNYQFNQKENYRTRLAGRLNKDGGEETPDIFRIHGSWLPMFEEELANVPSGTAKTLGLDDDFFGAYQNDLKVKGSYKAIPLMYDQLALYYNKDILNDAQKLPPKTWWGLRKVAKEMTVYDPSGNIKVAGAALGTVENVDHWSDILGLMMKQNGVDYLNLDEANQKKLKDILTFYTLFRTSDKVWDESLAPSTVQFANGKLAFYFAPSWRHFNIEELNPDLKFEIANVPQLPTLDSVELDKIESGEIEGNLTTNQWATYWVEGVNSKSKKQKEAWKFLEFLASKEGLEKLYTAASQTRTFGEIYPRKSLASKLKSNSKLSVFVAQADNGSSGYLSSRTFDDGLNSDLSKYFTDAINKMLTGNTSADDVIGDLTNGINQVKQKYQLKAK
jgi:ABC-type glycerol-3-phosphate transport system substrate-binding protein